LELERKRRTSIVPKLTKKFVDFFCLNGSQEGVRDYDPELDAGKGMQDIAIPLPGHSVRYPPNLYAFYKQRMSQDGLDPDGMKRSDR
jgi:hypothetical protein